MRKYDTSLRRLQDGCRNHAPPKKFQLRDDLLAFHGQFLQEVFTLLDIKHVVLIDGALAALREMEEAEDVARARASSAVKPERNSQKKMSAEARRR